MFIRQCYRRKDGKRHAYWALVESYRTQRGPRQRVVAWLGQMDEAGRLGVQDMATEQANSTHHQQRLFDSGEVSPRWIEVDASAVRSGVEVKLVPAPEGGKETFILCRSRDRSEKDLAIVRRFEQRIEGRLAAMAARCEKQRRDPLKVEREVGRLLGQNTRAERLFDVRIHTTSDGAARLEWKKLDERRDWATLSAGCYLLRSNVFNWSDDELWSAYIQLTEAEAAFRIQKSDLSLRPIWHQKEERVLAHILVCFLAYVLWKTLAALCRQAGFGDEPRRILSELSEIRAVDVILPTRAGTEIRKRCITRPSDHQAILLERLRLRLPRTIN